MTKSSNSQIIRNADYSAFMTHQIESGLYQRDGKKISTNTRRCRRERFLLRKRNGPQITRINRMEGDSNA